MTKLIMVVKCLINYCKLYSPNFCGTKFPQKVSKAYYNYIFTKGNFLAKFMKI